MDNYEPNKDFEKILNNYKLKKLNPFELLIRKIGNPKALDNLEKAINKYNEAVNLNNDIKHYDAKLAHISSEEFLYTALSYNYYEINFKPGASQYLIMEDAEERTESGLYLPPNADTNKPYNEGIIIGIGDCYIKTRDAETLLNPIHKIGEKVKYRKGIEIPIDVTVNGVNKKCKSIDFTVVIGTIGNYISIIGTSKASIETKDLIS